MTTEKTFSTETPEEVIQSRGGGRGKTEATTRKILPPDASRKKPSKYMNVNDLDIPTEISERFAKAGWALRYIRFIKPGTANELDYQNLGKKLQQGFVFVQAEDVPEIAITSFKRDINLVGLEGGDFKGIVVKGDLALMQVPLENIKERRAEIAKMNKEAMMAVDLDARRGNLINESESTSQVYGRGRNSFQED